MSRRLRLSGFTLLELLVVLVLAGISVAVVGGGAQAFMERARYHQTVRDVASRLSQARALCVQRGERIAVAYAAQSRELLVQGLPPLVLPQALDVTWQALPPEPKPSPLSGEAVFVFNPDGGARGGQFTVARGGQGVAFRINWLLGTIEQVAVVVNP